MTAAAVGRVHRAVVTTAVVTTAVVTTAVVTTGSGPYREPIMTPPASR